ncbi:helix-turn-helix domain-containing protein [Actinomadura scrupuli]|uniref:helix-turn-helix domain-containing protein n=1 Tax=Actinomadura scrupuli TaxID=559629 RepID=UPI003D96905C
MFTSQPDAPGPIRDLFDQPAGGPTVVRILLGAQLRRLREASGVTREAAGHAIRGSASKISRLELGRVGFKERDVADLCTLYGLDDERERSTLLALIRQANAPGWWHHYGDAVPEWFEAYVGLEQAASLIRVYEAHSVPGLLQTQDYARALFGVNYPAAAADEIDRKVDLRMTRQQLLMRADAPQLWVVMDEAAVRRPLGGRQVMREQLLHLLELTRLRNVTLQMVPFHGDGHPAIGAPFTILRFSQPDLPDIVYLEQLTSALYLDKREDLDHYMAVMNRLAVQATPDATVEMLHSVLHSM